MMLERTKARKKTIGNQKNSHFSKNNAWKVTLSLAIGQSLHRKKQGICSGYGTNKTLLFIDRNYVLVGLFTGRFGVAIDDDRRGPVVDHIGVNDHLFDVILTRNVIHQL